MPGTIRSNTLWNVAGSILPGLLALVVIPAVLQTAGTERFGAFSLMWAAVAYLSVFDVGLGRGVARHMANASRREAAAAYRTGLVMSAVVGLAGTMIVLVTLPKIMQLVALDDTIAKEVHIASMVLALIIPAVTIGSVAGGALEGTQQFKRLNMVNLPATLAAQAAPLAILPFTVSVQYLVAGMVAARWCGAVALLVCAREYLLRPDRYFPPGILIRYGGWLTVSNVLAPIITMTDRFVIGNIRSVAAVAVYTTSIDPISRIGIAGQALGRALFPRLAKTTLSKDDVDIYYRWLRILLATSLVTCTGLYVAASPLLTVWVGAEISSQALPVAQILLMGACANTVAALPTFLMYARGKPNIPSMVHICETVPYILLLVLLTERWGARGAAAAWAIRGIVDCVALLWLSRTACRLPTNGLGRDPVEVAALVSFATLAFLGLTLTDGERVLTLGLLAAGVLLFSGSIAWRAIQPVTTSTRLYPLRRWWQS